MQLLFLFSSPSELYVRVTVRGGLLGDAFSVFRNILKSSVVDMWTTGSVCVRVCVCECACFTLMKNAGREPTSLRMNNSREESPVDQRLDQWSRELCHPFP